MEGIADQGVPIAGRAYLANIRNVERLSAIPVGEQPRLMGMGDPRAQVALVTGDFRNAQYDPASLSSIPHSCLLSYPACAPDESESTSFWMPLSGPCDRVPDRRFQMGVCDRFNAPTGSKHDRKTNLVKTAIRPELQPKPSVDSQGNAVYLHKLRVPGQRQMSPGVPQVIVDSDHPEFEQTFATLHLPSTLSSIPGNASAVEEGIRCLIRITYGDPNDGTPLGRKAIFDCDLIPNSRDPGQHTSPREGSFSLAFTSGEGEGQGNVQPAKQLRMHDGGAKIERLLPVLARLGRIALRASVMKTEFDSNEARGILNNVPGFGSLENVFFTGVQLNVSSVHSKDLAHAIGGLQGRLHVDIHDCPASWTVVILIFRLPPNSDPGVFMFPEYGLFTHSVEHVFEDYYVCIIVFKGRHAHGGTAPRGLYSDAILKDIYDKTEGVNRCVYVLYANDPAVNRVGSFGIGLPVGFWVSSVIGQRKAGARTMAVDAKKVFVDRCLYSHWMFREIAYCGYNSVLLTLHSVGAPSDHVRISHHLKNSVYLDDDGTPHPIATPSLDPSADLAIVQHHREAYAGMFKIAEHFLLSVRKSDLRNGRDKFLAEEKEQRAGIFKNWTINVPVERMILDRGSWKACAAHYDHSNLRWLLAIRYESDGDRVGVHWVDECEMLDDDSIGPDDISYLTTLKAASNVGTGSSSSQEASTGRDEGKRKRTDDVVDSEKRPRVEEDGNGDDTFSEPLYGIQPEASTSGSDQRDHGHEPDEFVDDTRVLSDSDADDASESSEDNLNCPSELPIPITHAAVQSLCSELSSSRIQDQILDVIRDRGQWHKSLRRPLGNDTVLDIEEKYGNYRRLHLSLVDNNRVQDSAIGMLSLDILTSIAHPLHDMQNTHHVSKLTTDGIFLHACRFLVVAHEWIVCNGPRLADTVFGALASRTDLQDNTAWLKSFALHIRDVVVQGHDKTVDLVGFPWRRTLSSAASRARHTIHCPIRSNAEKAPSAAMRNVLERRLFVTELFFIIGGEGLEVACRVLGHRVHLPLTLDSACNVALTIGLTLKLFSETIGSEGVWCLPGLAHIWTMPHTLWGYPKLSKMAEPYLTAVYKRMRRNRPVLVPTRLDRGALQWTNWLKGRLAADTNLQAKLREHHTLIFTHVREVALGRVLDIVPDVFVKIAGKARQPSKRDQPKHGSDRVAGDRHIWDALKPADIVGDKGLNLNWAATILSHALHMSSPNPSLSLMFDQYPRIHMLLTGRDIFDGREGDKYTPDQFNAIRSSWQAIRFLDEAITADLLRVSPTAFCNLLAAVGTGQNSRTFHFLSTIWMPTCTNHGNQRNLPQTGAELAARVQVVNDQNISITDASANLGVHERTVSQRALMRAPEFHAVEDMSVWGVSSVDIGFGISRKGYDRRAGVNRLAQDDIDTKSASFFASKIQIWWRSHMEELKKGQRKKTWREMLEAIGALDTAPFKGTGLCPFQLTNHLAERGLCDLPTPDELAKWISANSKKGAFKGLLFLGFDVTNKDPARISIALRYLDAHFKQTMTDEVQELCHHGMIFLENLLCKISRVDNLLLRFRGTRDLRESISSCWNGLEEQAPFALTFNPAILEPFFHPR